MNRLIKIFVFLLTLLLLTKEEIFAQTYDFEIENTTTVQYITGEDFVNVKNEFFRKVYNKSYFFSKTGEKIFHIPDSITGDSNETKVEREFKKESISVVDTNDNPIPYTVEDLEIGQGIYVKVPNYRDTTLNSPYKIYLNYKTHIYVKSSNGYTVIQVPALHEDTEFSQNDETTGTTTKISYNLNIEVDNKISPISKIFPSKYTSTETDINTIYSFNGEDRVGIPIYLEFGTERVFNFEILLKTPKTDTLIPEKYSSAIKALSTNIYQVPLPREFAESNQKVLIQNISPQPTKISVDLEGNVTGTFEVPANQDSEILISGYIWVNQEAIENKREIPDLLLTEYLNQVKNDTKLKQYLTPTKYWETTDPFIKSKALELSKGKNTLLELIRNDYSYVNEVLEYDYSKVNNGNERIGAKAALQGGGSVCMEYSDAMIAILRAQGIPTRAAAGYVDIGDKKLEEGNIPHQWVQAWIPGYGWLSIDPTFESINMQIGTNIDSVLWETFYNDTDTNLGILSANSLNLSSFVNDNYKITIYSLSNEQIPDQSTLLPYSQLTTKETEPNMKDSVNVLVKTTPAGKAAIVILPIAIVLVLLLILFSLITILIRRIKARTIPSDQQL